MRRALWWLVVLAELTWDGLTGKLERRAPAPVPAPPLCRVPPRGWACSRVAGHLGPCAARQVSRLN